MVGMVGMVDMDWYWTSLASIRCSKRPSNNRTATGTGTLGTAGLVPVHVQAGDLVRYHDRMRPEPGRSRPIR